MEIKKMSTEVTNNNQSNSDFIIKEFLEELKTSHGSYQPYNHLLLPNETLLDKKNFKVKSEIRSSNIVRSYEFFLIL